MWSLSFVLKCIALCTVNLLIQRVYQHNVNAFQKAFNKLFYQYNYISKILQILKINRTNTNGLRCNILNAIAAKHTATAKLKLSEYCTNIKKVFCGPLVICC